MKQKLIEKTYKGELVQFAKQKDGTLKIERVLSTNPLAYISKDFMPGTIVGSKTKDKRTI